MRARAHRRAGALVRRDREIVRTRSALIIVRHSPTPLLALPQLIRPPMASSPFQTLPDDVLQRVLAGVPLDDHQATAATCQAFRAVLHGPRFLALRQRYGFAERGIVLVGPNRIRGNVSIRLAHQNGQLAIISGDFEVDSYSPSTTDGGARLFVSSRRPDRIFAIDLSSRRWRRLTTAPLNQTAYCMEWLGGRLYVAGGRKQGLLNTLHAFNETTGLWDDLPPMPHACNVAASGVIGNQLFIVGGYTAHSATATAFSSTLQIYNSVTRAWRLATPAPDLGFAMGVGFYGKLFVFGTRANVVYDPQSDTWTDESVPWRICPSRACAHNGRIVAIENRTAFARAADGTWSPDEPLVHAWHPVSSRSAIGSVLLG